MINEVMNGSSAQRIAPIIVPLTNTILTTWQVPANVYFLWVTLIGAGGAGGATVAGGSSAGGGGGGGGGEAVVNYPIMVTPGETFYYRAASTGLTSVFGRDGSGYMARFDQACAASGIVGGAGTATTPGLGGSGGQTPGEQGLIRLFPPQIAGSAYMERLIDILVGNLGSHEKAFDALSTFMRIPGGDGGNGSLTNIGNPGRRYGGRPTSGSNSGVPLPKLTNGGGGGGSGFYVPGVNGGSETNVVSLIGAEGGRGYGGGGGGASYFQAATNTPGNGAQGIVVVSYFSV